MSNDLEQRGSEVLDLAMQEWQTEEANGFATLRQIPCTQVRTFLAYCETLTPEERRLWRNVRLLRAPGYFLSEWWPHALSEENEKCLRRHLDAIAGHWWGWQSWGLRELKNAMSASESHWVPRLRIPPDAVEWLRTMATAKATQLRRLIKSAFGDELGLVPENQGGGDWLYRSPDDKGGFSVQMDFGGMGDQLRYEVQLEGAPPLARGLSYEALLGVAYSGWDWITEEEADESVALLVKLVKKVLDFASRVAASTGDGIA